MQYTERIVGTFADEDVRAPRNVSILADAGRGCWMSDMMRLLPIVLIALGLFRPLYAQPAAEAAPDTARVQVEVTCDRPDWLYAVGEPVRFTIKAVAGGVPLADAAVTYSVGAEMMPAEKKTGRTSNSGTLTIEGGTLQVPGFLRCSATIDHNGRTYRALATAGIAPEMIKPTQSDPYDFDAFWSQAKAELAALPIDARLTPLPEESDDKVEVFQVSLQNISTPPGRTSRFYGILCVPRGEGPFPAMMIPPGAGIRRLTADKARAAEGFITLQVGVHGVPVTLASELYGALGGAIGNYPTIHLEYRDRYYFRRVFMGCLRANEYLRTHAKWDGRNLIALGGSQGGFLSIVTTALDPKVTAIVAAFPAYCDVSGYAHGRAGGWPGMRFLADAKEPAREAKLANTAYYDAVNFARRIKVPGHYGWGFNDETCPPTSMYSAYNVITAPKKLTIVKEMGHPRVPELTAAEHDWLQQHLGRTR